MARYPIKGLFPPLDVEDITAQKCSTSFKVLVVAESFVSKPLLQRHRMVNEVLKEEMVTIHALELQTLTPGQWGAGGNHPQDKS
ncbi:bolA-like protein 2 [Rhinoraja longicauda]